MTLEHNNLDFTIKTYKRLIKSLQNQGFSFFTFTDFLKSESKTILLRHDVDLLPQNSLLFARILADFKIPGTFYFRIVPQSFDELVIKAIAELGHEVGYHYEDISIVAREHRAQSSGLRAQRIKEQEIVDVAIKKFSQNLDRMRQIVPVKTICMHGSPLSRWDSRLLWKYYDYRDFGLIGEPYFDINFNEVLYLTDTGRRWDGDMFNVRDRVQGSGLRAESSGRRAQGLKDHATSNQQPATFPTFHSTFDIINAANEGKLPDKIMMTFHPQRWSDFLIPWTKELVYQNLKNCVKYFIVE